MWSQILHEGEFLISDSSPTLANTLTLDKAGIDIDGGINNSAFSFSGICVKGQADVNISKGDLISKTSTGWDLANTSSAPSNVRIVHGLALEDKNAGEELLILMYGTCKNNTWVLPASVWYADDETLTSTPSSSFIQVVAKKYAPTLESTNDCIMFDPEFKYAVATQGAS